MIITSKMKVYAFILGILLSVGQAFALDCAAGTGWGDFLTVEATDSDGDGYYEIDTPEKLAWLSCMTVHKSNPYGAAKVKLTADLDLEGKLFIPISAGTGSPKFTGEIDGQGHSIVNLYIKGSEIANNATSEVTGESKNGAKAYAQNIGLVAVLSGNGKISNLTVGISDIYASTSAGETGASQNSPISVGTLVGWMEGGTVENCVVEGYITTSGDNNRVGGLVGNVKNATITNCLSLVSITASGQGTHVGGVVGALRNGGTVNLSSCIFAGDTLISTGGSLGGIVGNYESSTVKTQEGLYYSGDYSGVGNGKTVTTTKKDDVNTEEVVCVLNGGKWNSETGLCSGETSDMWSVGLSGLSMNGSDGYKVAFDANGGTFAAGSKTSKVVAKGAAITADEISVPTRTDNTFVGWAVASDATDPSASLGTANKSTTIYAVWEPMFKVTFSAAPGVFPEGSADTKEVSVSRGDIVSIEGFNVPETYKDASDGNKTYYFTGWAWESKKFPEDHEISSADTIHLADIILDKDTTIYAVWTAAKTVTVTYKANEHGKSRVEFMKVEAGSSVAQPEDPIADAGYSFVDWCMETPCEHVFDFETQISDNIILYAHWQAERFVINYELDGGTNNAANPSSYTIDTTDIVFAAPTKEGHSFDGWFYNYSNNEGVETFENLATQITSGSTGVKTLYAKWTPEKYIVRYNSGNTVSGTVTSDVKTYGEPMLLKGVQEVYAHAGCVQDGWSRAPYVDKNYNLDFAFDNDGKVWYEENANLIVYPHWTCNTYSINYNLGFGEGIVTNHNDNPGSYTGPAVLTLKNAYDPKNKMFMDNWFLEPTFKTAIRNIQDIEADLTVYAQWYTKINYNPGSRLKAVNNKLGKKEEKRYWNVAYTLNTSIKDFVLDNYTLDGWATSDNGEKVYDLGFELTENINLDLYPHWTPEAYPIVYHNIEGATFETPNPETYTVEDVFPITLNKPSKPGYTFVGWFTDAEFTGEAVSGIAAGSTGNAEFYAKWNATEYRITYNLDDGEIEGENPVTYTVSDAVVFPVPTKAGSKFLGWFDNVEFTGDAVSGFEAGETGDKEYFAKWAEFPITVATYGGVTILENEDGTRTAAIDASSMETVEIAEDVSVDNVTFDRAFTVGATSTIMLPFSIATSKVSGGKFYEFADLQKNEETGRWAASVKPPEQSELQANKPYLFIPEETSIVFNLGGEPVSLNTSVMNPSTSGNWSFKGVYEKTVFTEEHPELGKAYGFAAENKDGFKLGQFVKFGSGAWLRPFRAYLAYNESGALAKSTRSVRASLVNGELPETIDVEIQDGTTRVIGGGTLNTRTGEIKMDRWYDMNGRRLNSKPTTRGTYYHNGKRIVVR